MHHTWCRILVCVTVIYSHGFTLTGFSSSNVLFVDYGSSVGVGVCRHWWCEVPKVGCQSWHKTWGREWLVCVWARPSHLHPLLSVRIQRWILRPRPVWWGECCIVSHLRLQGCVSWSVPIRSVRPEGIESVPVRIWILATRSCSECGDQKCEKLKVHEYHGGGCVRVGKKIISSSWFWSACQARSALISLGVDLSSSSAQCPYSWCPCPFLVADWAF